MVFLFPLFVIVGATVAIVSPGPIFLKQTRVGYQGRPFTIWKFRTMKVGSNTAMHEAHFEKLMAADAPLTKLDVKGDPRIIPLGNLIRRCCLDELPQLFNVLGGSMSLVGPRPCLAFAVSQYLPWQRRRCDAFPGMTGLWQVSGKNKTTFKEMLRLDIAYVQQKTLALDLSIILRTVPAVLRELFEATPTTSNESTATSSPRNVLRIVNGGRKA
jgi:lipopolysaccharide/colanic/teichoic acid biosynthesis glycosyltransferase